MPYHYRTPGPDYVPGFSIVNPNCFGKSVPTGDPSKEILLVMIKNQNDEPAMKWLMNDF
jgi:hypothetical protein